MKGHIAKALFCAIAAALAVSAFAAAAEFTGSHVFNNEFETAGVDVRIEQFNVNENAVSPGEKVSYVPRVTNLDVASYVRVSFNIVTENMEGMIIGPDAFFGLEDGWIKKGNYFYYTRILKNGEEKNVLRGIDIPDDTGSKGSGFKSNKGRLSVTATVDAIQASNFTPDFEKMNPWGDVIIQRKNEDEAASDRAFRKADSVAGVAVHMPFPDFTYAREGTFECSTEDLFSGFESFQPGNACSELLNMKNDSDSMLEIHFKTENQKTELLDEMKLSISCCGDEVYNGPLSSENLESFIPIGTIPSGKSGKIEFEISMPKSADNSFSKLKDNVTWIIAVNEKKTEGKPLRVTQTGDDMLLPEILILMLTAALLAAVITLLVGSRKD